MKKVSLVIVLLCSFWINAQQREMPNNTVSVSGRALIEREITAYKAKITLNMEQLYYSDPSIKTLQELKDKYFKELKAHGFNSSDFIENEMEFLAYGYQREGTVLELKTTSEEKIKNLAKVKMTGVTAQYQFKSEINNDNLIKLLEKSMDNAKENAERTCKLANKDVGDIVSITDSSVQLSIWNSYGSSYEEYYTIYVTYQMK